MDPLDGWSRQVCRRLVQAARSMCKSSWPACLPSWPELSFQCAHKRSPLSTVTYRWSSCRSSFFEVATEEITIESVADAYRQSFRENVHTMHDLSNEFERLMEEWKKTETKFIFATNLGIPPTPDEAGYDLETNRFHRSDTEWIWAFCLAGHVVPPKRKSWESSHEKSGSVFLSPEHHYRCQDLCSPCHPRRHMDEHFQGRQGRMVCSTSRDTSS